MKDIDNDKFLKYFSKSIDEEGTFYTENDKSDNLHHSHESFKIRDKKTNSLYISMNFDSLSLLSIYKTSTRDIQNYLDSKDNTHESPENKKYIDGYKKLQIIITISIDEFIGRNLLTEKASGHKRHIK